MLKKLRPSPAFIVAFLAGVGMFGATLAMASEISALTLSIAGVMGALSGVLMFSIFPRKQSEDKSRKY